MLSTYSILELHVCLIYLRIWRVLANTILVVILVGIEIFFLKQRHTGLSISISHCLILFPQVTHCVAPAILSTHLRWEGNNYFFNTLKWLHQLLMKRSIWIVLKVQQLPMWSRGWHRSRSFVMRRCLIVGVSKDGTSFPTEWVMVAF